MSANTAPLFSLTPNAGATWTIITAANTAMDGTGTVTTIWTAGANGSFLEYVSAKPVGTNVATVARIFINNSLTNATPANNVLVDEIQLQSTSASNSVYGPRVATPFNIMINAGYKINVTLGTAVSAGWIFFPVGGDY